MILPVIKTPSFNHTRVLSARIDNLLESCEMLEYNSPTHQELTKGFNYYRLSLEQLRPSKTIHTRSPNSFSVEEYVKERYKSTEIPIRDIMNSTHANANLSFDNFNHTEASKTLSKRKRKFGDGWKEVYSSSIPGNFASPERVQIEKTKINKNESVRKKALGGLIQNFIGKKLGLICKVNIEKRDKPVRKRANNKRPTFIGNSNIKLAKLLNKAGKTMGASICDDEREYLEPEMENWTTNTKEKLFLERIIGEQHQKERKQQIAEGVQLLKTLRYESTHYSDFNN